MGESGVAATFLYQVLVHPCGAVCLLVTFYRALAMTDCGMRCKGRSLCVRFCCDEDLALRAIHNDVTPAPNNVPIAGSGTSCPILRDNVSVSVDGVDNMAHPRCTNVNRCN